MYWSGQIMSNNPYPKPWKARTRRALNGWGTQGCWYPEKAVISYAPQISAGTVGAWDASANLPKLTSGVGFGGQTFNVSVAGTTNLDGITNWNFGEMASFNGDTVKWEKVTSGETVIKAMNPAHILYQCITDPSWGRGMDRAELDNDAWVYAANYLFNEQFGLCIRWSKDGDINDFIQTIIDHIGGALYIDRGTGLMVLRLIRKDYDLDKLPVFTYSSGLLSVDTQETGATLVIANEVVVKWHDPIRDQDRQTRVHNLASMQSLGYPISMTRDFPGIPDPDLAQRIALRELEVGSAGIKRLKLRFDRRAWRMQPGMVMRIQAPDKGITDMVLRVVTYDDGTMIDGTISMDCLQDVFGMPSTVYTTPVDNPTTERPSGAAPPIKYEAVQEATYLDMQRGLNAADFAAVGDTEGGLIGMAGRPNTVSQYPVMLATPVGGKQERDPGIFAPTAVSGRPLGFYDINIFVSNGADLDKLTVGMTGVLGGVELVRVATFTPASGTIVIDRGGGDTVPVQHVGGEVAFFNDVTMSMASEAYETGDVLHAQLQNVGSGAASDINLSPVHVVPIVARHFMPYVMGDLRLNGTPALSPTTIGVSTGSAAFTWASRNRLLQSDQFIPHDGGPVSAEAGTTYTVEVWDTAAGTIIRSHAGLTTSNYTYNDAEKASGAPDPVALTFVFYTMRSGTRSFNIYRIPIYYVSHGEGVGHAMGVGQAAAVGSNFQLSVGHATGTSMTTNAVGSAAGHFIAVGHAAGFGGVRVEARGLSMTNGDALGVGAPVGIITSDESTAKGVGDANAPNVSTGFLTGTGNAVGRSDARGLQGYAGSAVGHGVATGRGSSIVSIRGSAIGIGGAVAIHPETDAGIGEATGTGTADGIGSIVLSSVGVAAGVGAATGVPVTTVVISGTGAASGTGAMSGIGVGAFVAVGSASGVGSANGVVPFDHTYMIAGIGAVIP
jgi:hypothetical protein